MTEAAPFTQVPGQGHATPTGSNAAAAAHHAPVLPAPDNPVVPGARLEPFAARLQPPRAHVLPDEASVTRIEMREGLATIHPHLPPVPVWGYALDGDVTTPGPLLEARAGRPAVLRFDNRLPGSLRPGQMAPQLPFLTNLTPDPGDGEPDPQNLLGTAGTETEDLSGAPVGWTAVHLHGGHSRPDADGWPDDMAAVGSSQLNVYDNSYDNLDLGLGKVGGLQWYHDHAMNGTRFHVYAGLAAGYLVRDEREAELGLPTSAGDGEIVAILQDRNVGVDTAGDLRLLHKTTASTGEFFGPLTLVNGQVWPRLVLRPEVYRLRLLNGANARTYRLHLVSVEAGADGVPVAVTPHHGRVLVVGTDGGLLWRAAPQPDGAGLTLAPAERLDLLVDLGGLQGRSLYLVNSAPAPFGGQEVPDLLALLRDGDTDGKNPYPQVLRIDVDAHAVTRGKPAALMGSLLREPELNPAFRRLVHDDDAAAAPGEPLPLAIEGHQHHVVLLAETDPPGHLYLHELVEDPAGDIELQLPPATLPTRYSVVGWMPGDPTPSSARMSFYDQVGVLPELGRWQVFVFVNTTGDTHPLHIHQSQFQPLGTAGATLAYATGDGDNLYDPTTRSTSAPIVPDPATAPRSYEPHEVHGWKDVVRVDPGNVVKVAIRFDLPGRYVYHCHVLEHEDTEMMRPLVVTVTDMNGGHMRM